jgi:hypothetical protein
MIALAASVGCSSATDNPAADEQNPQMGDGFLIGDEAAAGGTSGGTDQGPSCQGETRKAEAIGLDIFVMLDSSGSMLDVLPSSAANPAAAQITKWDAVRSSLEAFLQAPETAGIGVGLQYFPQSNEGVPASCETNDECGSGGGPCTSSLCVVDGELDVVDGAPPFDFVRFAGADPRFCVSDEDCTGYGESCRTMVGECVFPPNTVPQNPEGAFVNVSDTPAISLVSPLCSGDLDCQGLPQTICEEIGVCSEQFIKCSLSIGCPTGAGECVPFPYSCFNQTSCDVGAYSVPAVPISDAATHGAEIIGSLAEQFPQGQTPTGPALTGALEHARLWAEQHLDRQVVTVLATDGFPTVCEPLAIDDIADVALGAATAARPVRTFVIGVFGNGDLGGDGQQRLDGIARAGGSDHAIVVNTAGNVTEDFLQALNVIRNTALSCDFQLDPGAALDFDRVNLQVNDPVSGSRELFNVGDVSACGDGDGWYYVRDVSGNPTQIRVCSSTCAAFTGEGVSADLQIGCATRIR